MCAPLRKAWLCPPTLGGGGGLSRENQICAAVYTHLGPLRPSQCLCNTARQRQTHHPLKKHSLCTNSDATMACHVHRGAPVPARDDTAAAAQKEEARVPCIRPESETRAGAEDVCRQSQASEIETTFSRFLAWCSANQLPSDLEQDQSYDHWVTDCA